MEAQATAQARRVVSLRKGTSQYRSIRASPARPPPTHPCLLQDSRPGGGSRRHDPHWAAPPAGQYTTSGWDRPHRAETNREPRKIVGDSQPHNSLGIVVPTL